MRTDTGGALLRFGEFKQAVMLGGTVAGAAAFISGQASSSHRDLILAHLEQRAAVPAIDGGAIQIPSYITDAALAAAPDTSVPDRMRDDMQIVEANVSMLAGTDAGTAFIVGAGQPKGITASSLNRVVVEPFTAAAIRVYTREIERSLSPAARRWLARDGITALNNIISTAFIDPSIGPVAGVFPGSVTHGAGTVIPSTGVTLSAIVSDLKALVATHADAAKLWFVMSRAMGRLIASLQTTTGAFAFSDINLRTGTGSIWGIPLILSSSARPTGSPTESFCACIDASKILFADVERVDVARSEDASLSLRDDPVAGAVSNVSLWQNNLVAGRLERVGIGGSAVTTPR